MIIGGYVACIAYVFFLIFAVGPFVQKKTSIESSRKTIHTMLFVVWVLIDIFLKNTIHQIIVPVIFIILNALSYKFKFYKSVEREEGNHLGTVYFAIAITVIMTVAYFFPTMYYATGIASFCLTVGDGFAALIGYNTKSRKLISTKTLNGTISCIVASAICIFAFCSIYPVHLSIVSILLIAVLTGILELTGKGLDNFTISFGVFLASNALINNYSSNLLMSLAIAILIFTIVFFAKAITYAGSLFSMVIVFSFSYFGGIWGLTFLLLTYFTIFFVAILKKRNGKRESISRPRGFLQILINGGLGTLFIILFGISKKPEFMIISVVAIGGCFVDSLSSDIGVLSSKAPIDIIKFKPIDNGLSGGVSVLGTTSAFVASLLIAIYTKCFFETPISTSIFICALVFFQTVLDSILGSVFQAKYKCTACGKITETHCCCDMKTEHYSGIMFVNNNMVNILTSLIVVAIAIAIFAR